MEKDIIDHANEFAAAIVDAELQAISSLVPEPKDELTDDDLVCESCGVELDPRRAALGYTNCPDCSAFFAKQEKAQSYRRNHQWED